MEKHRAIERCRTELMPRLESLAAQLASEFPHVRSSVFDGPVGSATTYQGHHVGVECLFSDVPRDEPDNVALRVDLGTNHGEFVISADVCWGEGAVEAQLLPDQTPVSEEALRKVTDGLPILSDALIDAVRRGRPRP